MKMLSDNAVTKTDLTAIDEKQTRQILQLRIAVGVSFVVNLAVALIALFK